MAPSPSNSSAKNVLFIYIAIWQLAKMAIDANYLTVLVDEPADSAFNRVERMVTTAFQHVFMADSDVAAADFELRLLRFSELTRSMKPSELLDPFDIAPSAEPSSANPLSSTRSAVCGKVVDRSFAVIIFDNTDKSELDDQGRSASVRLKASIAYTLGFYQVPVISVSSRDSDYSDKSIYRTFMRTVPPWSSQARIAIDLLKVLAYDTLVLLHEDTAESEAFAIEFIELARAAKIKIQYDITVGMVDGEKDPPRLNVDLTLELIEATANIFVLDASAQTAQLIFSQLSEGDPLNDRTGFSYGWIVTQQTIGAENVPQGTLAIRLSTTPMEATVDAFRTARLAHENWLEKRPADKLRPLRACNETVLRWVKMELGYQLYENGDRRQASYHIVNILAPGQIADTSTEGLMTIEGIDKPAKVVGHTYLSMGEGKKTLQRYITVDQKQIIWPGNSEVKPIEITLPRELTVVTVIDPPFVYEMPHLGLGDQCNRYRRQPPTVNHVVVNASAWLPCKRGGMPSCCAGLAIDLLVFLRSAPVMPVKFKIDLQVLDTYGAFNHSTDSWSGMVGALDSRTADLAIGALSMNAHRENTIDFSIPWLYHGIAIIEKTKARLSPMKSFLQPYKPELWACLFGSVFAIGVALFFLDKLSPFAQYWAEVTGDTESASGADTDDPDVPLNFSGAMWFVWGVLLDSGIGERSPRSLSARVLGMVWCGFSMIMVASYTANLAAFLVLDQPQRGLTGINDPRLRNPSANFTFATVQGSNTYSYFKRHVELNTMARMMEGRNFANATLAIAAMKADDLDAFVWDSVRLEFEAAKDCSLRISGSLFGQNAYAIGLQKDSIWTRLVSLGVLHLIENGTMENLEARWITAATPLNCKQIGNSPARLGLQNMKDVFILVAMGIAVGCVVCVFERIWRKHIIEKHRQRKAAKTAGTLWRKRTSGDVMGQNNSNSNISSAALLQKQKNCAALNDKNASLQQCSANDNVDTTRMALIAQLKGSSVNNQGVNTNLAPSGATGAMAVPNAVSTSKTHRNDVGAAPSAVWQPPASLEGGFCPNKNSPITEAVKRRGAGRRCERARCHQCQVECAAGGVRLHSRCSSSAMTDTSDESCDLPVMGDVHMHDVHLRNAELLAHDERPVQLQQMGAAAGGRQPRPVALV